jgi:hypothetical protein
MASLGRTNENSTTSKSIHFRLPDITMIGGIQNLKHSNRIIWPTMDYHNRNWRGHRASNERPLTLNVNVALDEKRHITSLRLWTLLLLLTAAQDLTKWPRTPEYYVTAPFGLLSRRSPRDWNSQERIESVYFNCRLTFYTRFAWKWRCNSFEEIYWGDTSHCSSRRNLEMPYLQISKSWDMLWYTNNEVFVKINDLLPLGREKPRTVVTPSFTKSITLSVVRQSTPVTE